MTAVPGKAPLLMVKLALTGVLMAAENVTMNQVLPVAAVIVAVPPVGDVQVWAPVRSVAGMTAIPPRAVIFATASVPSRVQTEAGTGSSRRIGTPNSAAT